ncbi:MAG TPA: hypothetical protein VEK34_14390 [Methylocella sp.]|nr:hypothetical protein [Methylocella sp.]
MLDEKRSAAKPVFMRGASFAGPSAYEEDCDWCMPALVFEKEFRAFHERQSIKQIEDTFAGGKDALRMWHLVVYEAFSPP